MFFSYHSYGLILSYAPLKKNAMKSCKQGISKTIGAKCIILNLNMLTGDDEQTTRLTFENNPIFLPELWPFENFGILTVYARYLGNCLRCGIETFEKV